MMRGMAGLVGAFAFLVLFSSRLPAQDVIKVRGGPASKMAFVEYNEEGLTVKSGGGTKTYRWEQLDPKCVYDVMRKHMDQDSAPAHWALAEYCAAAGLTEEARREYRLCRQTDFSYRNKTETALAGLESSDRSRRSKTLPCPVPPGGSSAQESGPAEKEGVATKPPAKPRPSQERPADDGQALDEQRHKAEKINEELDARLRTYETPHFIIHSDSRNAGEIAGIRKCAEAAYNRISDILGVKPDDKLWDGKCEIYVFASEVPFMRFAKRIDHYADGWKAGGYFSTTGRTCHIVIPEFKGGSLLDTLIHELTHGFVRFYIGTEGNVKPWWNEGLAQFMEIALLKGGVADRETKRSILSGVTDKNYLRFSELRSAKQILATDAEFYALSLSIVDYMVTVDRTHKKFAKFIGTIKAGGDDEKAIQEAYGQTPDELEQSWLRYVRSLR